MRIAMVELPDEITAITLEIMHALPAWFSPPGDIDRKAIQRRRACWIHSVENTQSLHSRSFQYGYFGSISSAGCWKQIDASRRTVLQG